MVEESRKTSFSVGGNRNAAANRTENEYHRNMTRRSTLQILDNPWNWARALYHGYLGYVEPLNEKDEEEAKGPSPGTLIRSTRAAIRASKQLDKVPKMILEIRQAIARVPKNLGREGFKNLLSQLEAELEQALSRSTARLAAPKTPKLPKNTPARLQLAQSKQQRAQDRAALLALAVQQHEETLSNSGWKLWRQRAAQLRPNIKVGSSTPLVLGTVAGATALGAGVGALRASGSTTPFTSVLDDGSVNESATVQPSRWRTDPLKVTRALEMLDTGVRNIQGGDRTSKPSATPVHPRFPGNREPSFHLLDDYVEAASNNATNIWPLYTYSDITPEQRLYPYTYNVTNDGYQYPGYQNAVIDKVSNTSNPDFVGNIMSRATKTPMSNAGATPAVSAEDTSAPVAKSKAESPAQSKRKNKKPTGTKKGNKSTSKAVLQFLQTRETTVPKLEPINSGLSFSTLGDEPLSRNINDIHIDVSEVTPAVDNFKKSRGKKILLRNGNTQQMVDLDLYKLAWNAYVGNNYGIE